MKGKKKIMNQGICKFCGIFVRDLGRHLRRGRCKEQHKRGGKYNSEKYAKNAWR